MLLILLIFAVLAHVFGRDLRNQYEDDKENSFTVKICMLK